MTHNTLDAIARLFIGLSVVSAAWVLVDIFVRGQRQHMKIMEAVWPLTMLYWGPLGLVFYYWFGRPGPARNPGHSEKPMWQATFSGASHCGAGCALGDFVGDWLAFGLSFTLVGSDLIGKMLVGFVLAYLFGIFFQYFSVAPMRGLSLMDGIVTAIKIDTFARRLRSRDVCLDDFSRYGLSRSATHRLGVLAHDADRNDRGLPDDVSRQLVADPQGYQGKDVNSDSGRPSLRRPANPRCPISLVLFARSFSGI